ncbi:hypothetical protein A0H81_06248 [Grifola frondosa]|uniref:BTB domain-containing protein n=1 Tax=Grifola frondosa TaxID=5627 RepID=A0A1C7MB01_GRIFR|nr:hypothetical protein A0H81_06248 [Grifola frondosa]
MEDATDFLTARLASLATDNPLRIYVMACTFDLDDVAQLAAKEVLRQKAYTTTAVIPELDTITAGVYYRLLRYCGSNGLAEEVLSFVHPPAQSSPGIDSAAQNGDTSRSITNAPHPFDREDADIVLCSSDLVHFRVHSAILRMASPYLRDKLTESSQELPDCCKESTTALRSLPVITLAEDSLTISSLGCLL